MVVASQAAVLWLALWAAASLGQPDSGFVRVVYPASPQNASFYFVRAGVRHYVPECAVCNGINQCLDAPNLQPTELMDTPAGSALIGCDTAALDKAPAPVQHKRLEFIERTGSSSVQKWQQANGACRADGLSLCKSGQLCIGSQPSSMLRLLGDQGMQPTADAANSWLDFSVQSDTCSVHSRSTESTDMSHVLCCAKVDLHGFDLMFTGVDGDGMRLMLPHDVGAQARGVVGPHWDQSSPMLCSRACLERSSGSCVAFVLVEKTHCYLLNKAVSVAATQPTFSYLRQNGALEQADVNLLLHKSAALAGNPDGGVYTTDGQLSGRCEQSAGDNAWWKSDLGAELPVTTVKMAAGASGSANVQLQVTLSSTAAGGVDEVPCGPRVNLALGATATARCNPSVHGRYIFIRPVAVDSVLSLCEVSAFGPSYSITDPKQMLSEESIEAGARMESIESDAQVISAQIISRQDQQRKVRALKEEIVLGKSQLAQGLAEDEYKYTQGSVAMHISEKQRASKAALKYSLENSHERYYNAIAHTRSKDSNSKAQLAVWEFTAVKQAASEWKASRARARAEYLSSWQAAESTYNQLVVQAQSHRKQRDLAVRQMQKKAISSASETKKQKAEQAADIEADKKAQVKTDYTDLMETPEVDMVPDPSSCSSLRGLARAKCLTNVENAIKNRELVQSVAKQAAVEATQTNELTYTKALSNAQTEQAEALEEASTRMRELLLTNRKEMQDQEEIAKVTATAKQRAADERKTIEYQQAQRLLEGTEAKIREEMIRKLRQISEDIKADRSTEQTVRRDSVEKAQIVSARAEDKDSEDKREALQIAQQHYMANVKSAIRAQAIEIKQLNSD